jgi:phage gpG-like protein
LADNFSVIGNAPAVIAQLNKISRQFADLSPAMRDIGEELSESVKLRFSTSTAPDGSMWKPNAPATVLQRLNDISGSFSKKTGKLTKRGAAVAMNKKPLVDSGILQDTIRYQLVNGGNGVEIGTDRFSNTDPGAGGWEGGAAVHQFGSRDGSIPARPFLGLSPGDESEILAILQRFAFRSAS